MSRITWSDENEDQLVQLRWSGEYEDDQPPHVGSGGWDHIIGQRIYKPVNVYGCRYCGADVRFKNRLPQNLNGTAHRCLAEKRAAMTAQRAKTQAPGGDGDA